VKLIGGARPHRRPPPEDGVGASDPITFTFIAFTLLTIAFVARWIPGPPLQPRRRMVALRAE
jgi:hypothetical protein